MVAKTVQLTLGAKNSSEDTYWLNLVVKKDPLSDGMTVAQAADIIDAAYNVKPCEAQVSHDNWAQGEGRSADVWTDASDNTGTDADTVEAKSRFAASIKNYTEDCEKETLEQLIGYDVTVQVYRSHYSELYKLQAVGGRVGTPRRFADRVTELVDVSGVTSVTLDRPIITYHPGSKAPVAEWQGDNGGDILITGNTLSWETPVTSVIRVDFDTEWDEVVVHVVPDYTASNIVSGVDSTNLGVGWYSGSEDGSELTDYKDVQCALLGFYHYQYSELTLTRPEPDTSTTETEQLNICHFVTTFGSSGTGSTGGETNPDDKCIRAINETVKCYCNNKKASHTYYEAIPCPAGYRDGSVIPGSTDKTTYKDCGYLDDVNNPDYYLQKCCYDWPFDAEMPHCKKITIPFNGGAKPDFDTDSYPDGTVFIAVGPAGGNCGDWIITQDVTANQCCDGVDKIIWDYSNSATVIGEGLSAKVFVSGGKAPYSWSVRGSGFYTNAACTQRDAVTNTGLLTLYAKNSCGTAQIHVTDGCSSDSCAIMSSVGVWQDVSPQSDLCRLAGPVSGWSKGPNVYDPYIKDQCGIRTVMSINFQSGSGAGECSDQSYPNCGNAVPPNNIPDDFCITDYAEYQMEIAYPGFVGDVSMYPIAGYPGWLEISYEGVGGDGCGPAAGCTAPATPRCCGIRRYTYITTIQEWVCPA